MKSSRIDRSMNGMVGIQTSLRAVSNPGRTAILRLVWDAELSSGEIADRLGVSWPLVSHNLRVLREAGLVRARREGKRRLYRADRRALRPLAGALQEMWRTGLERMAHLAEQEERGGRR